MTPNAEQLALFGGFETALFGVLGHDDLCWAAAVLTTASSRRFLLYARDRAELLQPLALIKQEFPFEFKLDLHEDPDWAAFRRVPGRAGA